jgi:hypothetical protein
MLDQLANTHSNPVGEGEHVRRLELTDYAPSGYFLSCVHRCFIQFISTFEKS